MIRIRGLSAGYGAVPVLRDISLDLEPGTVTLLLGPNGAGKTTLLKTIAGFVRPSDGRIHVGDRELPYGKPSRTARMGVRLVLEGHRVMPGLTVRQNLELARFTLAPGQRYEERLDYVVKLFPILAERFSQYASDLSGGQQQLLAMSQAILARPQCLLCDEPSFGIAQILVPQILGALRQVAAAGGTVLLVEQLVDSALPFADRVLILNRGRIVFDEPAAAHVDDTKRIKQILLSNEDLR